MKLVRTSNNTFYRTADGQETYSREYEVGEKTARDIEDLANEYGQTDDVLRLYDDSNKLIAMAMWPQTGGGYRYCYGKYLSENPAWCVWRSSSKSSKHAESEIFKRYRWTIDGWGNQTPPQNADRLCSAANALLEEFIEENPDVTEEEVQDYSSALWERYCERDEVDGIKSIWQ